MYENYDVNVDHLTIYFDKQQVDHTDNKGKVLLFYDGSGKVIGIEVRGVKKLMNESLSTSKERTSVMEEFIEKQKRIEGKAMSKYKKAMAEYDI